MWRYVESVMWGNLEDIVKCIMASVKKDIWKIYCVKATSHKACAPRSNAVRAIKIGSLNGSARNRKDPAGAILYHLLKRMMANDWIVTLKTQAVFHELLRHGNDNFVEPLLTSHRSSFNMTNFEDSSRPGKAVAHLIKSYGAFMEKRLMLKADINFPPGNSNIDDLDVMYYFYEAQIDKVVTSLHLIMDTIDALLLLDSCIKYRVYTPVAAMAVSLTTEDMNRFRNTLAAGVTRLLELFFILDVTWARTAADAYKRFVGLVERAPFDECLNAGWKTPELQASAASVKVMQSMQRYIDNGGVVSPHPGEAGAVAGAAPRDYSDEGLCEIQPSNR